MVQTILSILQLIFAILLIISVLLQQKGAGLGAAFGGSSTIYTTRRGVDKVLFQASIVIAILFFLISFVSILL